MDWLNYHHLLYFWTVAREGGLAPASRLLRLARPTLSGQIKQLEEQLGEALLRREGRRLVLTETGQLVFRYANEIFGLGRELMDAVRGRASASIRLRVGITDVVPKLITGKILEPALRLEPPVSLLCVEGRFEHLLAELATHELDVVLADGPVPPGSKVRVFNHPLGSCGVSFFATPALARALRGRFPHSLDGAPFVMPTVSAHLQGQLQMWFESKGVKPSVRAEIADSALLKSFGARGLGVFAAPTVIEASVRDQFDVKVLGRTDEIQDRFYAISVERKLKHPAVAAITASARSKLFA